MKDILVEHTQGDGLISTDKSRLQMDVIHDFLTHAPWSPGISVAILEKAIQNSVCFGVYEKGEQVGFARVISDFATFAYISDLFILPTARDRGLAQWLVKTIVEHPDLQGLRRFCLITRNAQSLYEPFGFEVSKYPERFMEILDPEIYRKLKA